MRSIFLKIFLWFWLTMVLIALSFAVVLNLESEANPSRQSLTGNAVAMYAASAAEVFEDHGPQAVEDFLRRLNESSHIRAVLLGANSQRLAGDLKDPDSELVARAISTGQTQIEMHAGFAPLAREVKCAGADPDGPW